MKAFVQFLKVNHTNHTVETALGSDGVFILDGRNTLYTMKRDAEERLHKLRHVQEYCGYQIRKGDLRDSRVVYQWVQYAVRRMPVNAN